MATRRGWDGWTVGHAFLVGTLVLGSPLAAQTGVTNGQWPHYGGDQGATRYSSLDQIDPTNAADLQIAWRWQTRNFGPRPEYKYEATPIMVDGVLYTTAGGGRRTVVAIDAESGETLWMYRHDDGARAATAPRKNSGRGVAYWSDGNGDDRVLVITPGYFLVALDAATGRRVPTFGNDGVVDLKQGLDADVDSVAAVIGASSPPMIVGDVAVIGAALEVGFYPPSRRNVPGHVRGFDVRTGERKWIFHTIPHPGEFGHDTWLDSAWAYTGNAAVWAPMSADPDLGYVYLPVEAATSDFTGGHRPGNNLFSSTLVCLNANTGERVWHFQLVHHDIWDSDIPAAPILLDITVGGRPVQAVAQVTKQNFTYVFDRVTGAPVWPIEERPVPQTDIPGEWTSPTQPFPTKPSPFDRQGFSEDDLIDFTPELFAEALTIARRYRWGSLFAPGSLVDTIAGTQGTLRFPKSTGGANWEGGAVDVEAGMLYVSSVSSPAAIAIGPGNPERTDLDYLLLRDPNVRGPRRLPLTKPPYGRITAIDLNTGEHVWMVPNGGTPASIADHPALANVDLTPTGHPTRAVLLVTKTLLFAGEGYGADPLLHVLDKATGRSIVDLELPAPATGLPMTYLHDGKQYVVLPVGGRGHAGELVALALP